MFMKIFPESLGKEKKSCINFDYFLIGYVRHWSATWPQKTRFLPSLHHRTETACVEGIEE